MTQCYGWSKDLVLFGELPAWLCFLGMVDIARQTVEFLYEENGGIPRDLYLPTIEDIKDEANKFTIDKVRKGSAYPLTSSVKLPMGWEVGFSLECEQSNC